MKFWNGYLKAEFNKSGMKQITNSGFKTFDKQNNLVATGNVISNCQISLFLSEYAIKESQWKDTNPEMLRNIASLGSSVIFYEFFVRHNRKRHVFYQTAVDNDTGKKVWEKLFTETGDYNKRNHASKWIDMYITKQENDK